MQLDIQFGPAKRDYHARKSISRGWSMCPVLWQLEEAIVDVEDQETSDITEPTREELQRWWGSWRMARSQEAMRDSCRIGEELRAGYGWLVVGATERSVENEASALEVEECHPDPTSQEAKQEGLRLTTILALLCSAVQGRCCPWSSTVDCRP